MKAVSYNQRNGGQRKALCPGAPQGPARYQGCQLKKNMYNLKVEDFVLFGGHFEDFKPPSQPLRSL